MKRIKIFGALGLATLFSAALFLVRCNGSDEEDTDTGGPTVVSTYNHTIKSPFGGKTYTPGEEISVEINLINVKEADSLYVFLDKKKVFATGEKKNRYHIAVKTDSLKVGLHSVKVIHTTKEKNREVSEVSVVILSDLEPLRYGYKVIKQYPHDPDAYTQGLVFENGLMYEGTGLNGKSELRLVDFAQNKVLKSYKLPGEYFGEGVAVMNNKIYQLTYKSHVGLIYDKNTFKQIGQFSYPTEGWGLTHDGKNLLMSDGSNKIYFLDPNTLQKVNEIEVYNNVAAIMQLNELEYIDGEIWANVYQTDYIVRIDPATGKVTGLIDLTNILDEQFADQVDVLNGIAYDPATKKVYITGKLWPKLFEIQLVEGVQ